MLFYEELGFKIKNYDLEPITYFHQGKERKYFPDFILDNKLIVEVKGFFFGKEEEIQNKRIALNEWCKTSNYSSAFITKQHIPEKFIKKAKKMHRTKIEKRIYGRRRKKIRSRKN